MVHPIAGDDEVEPAFDAIVYGKGAAVLEMFERWAGADAFRAAVRAYVAAHAGRSVGSRAFLDALAAATSPAVAAALASQLGHAGLPVVEFAIACDAAGPSRATIVAAARDGVTVPVCVRYPIAGAATARACWLAGAHSEQALPAAAGCPAWLVGNDGAAGYYRTAWRAGTRAAPLDALSPDERAAHGDDVAGAVAHGELAIAGALAELTAFAARRDPEDRWIALAIADAIDPWVAEPVRPAWRAWLARQFADALAPEAVNAQVRQRRLGLDHLLGLVGDALDPATSARARAVLARDPTRYGDALVVELAAAGPYSQPLFDRVAREAAAQQTAMRAAGLEPLDELGRFPGAYAPRIVELLFDRRFAAADVWPAVAAQLQRGDSRGAAWRALHARFAQAIGALSDDRLDDVVGAAAALCSARERAELVADVAAPRAALRTRPGVARAVERALGHALATIDRCIARRAQAGDLAAALAAATPAVRQRAAARP
jgi:hypothetical protein